MKNTLKYAFILLLMLPFSMADISAATPVNMDSISSPETVCNDANVNDTWYIGEARYPRDWFV